MLTVSSPASDRTLLTDEELRTAAGVRDGTRDSELRVIGSRVAAAIARVCRVAAGGVTPPTLRQETLTETLRLDRRMERLVLSRVPIASVTSVTEAGVILSATDYETEAAAGLIRRIENDSPGCWAAGKIVVVYVAGWSTVPDDLKLAAAKLVQAIAAEGGRDPGLKRVNVPDVIEREYWVGPADDPLVPDEVMDLLAPYIVHRIG